MEAELTLFYEFINNYDLNIDAIRMKEEHTYRVVEYAKEIAMSLSLSNKDVRLACICALFHDLGRFPQYTKFHTYNDLLSFDHGDKSYDILKELEYDDNIVLNAVKYHNKYSVPNDLSSRETLFTNITRDADKLDILFSQCNYDYKENYKISNEIMDYFNEKLLILNNSERIETVNRLRKLAFIFDINFHKSIEMIKDSNIINEKIDTIYKATNDENILEIKEILNKFMNERIRKENVRKKIRSQASRKK